MVVAEDASRFRERFPDWDRYGISAFHAASDEEIDALCQARLVRFETILVFRRIDLEAVGVEIVPTFRTPHVTLCHHTLEELVTRLHACGHARWVNPYHVGERDSDDR